MAVHISKSFLGQHYKLWRKSPDAKNFKGSELGAYAVQNDLSKEITDQLREWEAAGFPDEGKKKK